MILYLSAIILSFFLAVILFTKRNKTPGDYVLAAWLGIIGIHLLTWYLFFTGQQFDYPTVVVLGFSLPLVHGPFLYLYTRQQTSPAPFKLIQLLHFLPYLLSVFLFAGFHFLSPEQKIEVFRQKGLSFRTQIQINVYAIYISGIVYVVLAFVRLLRYRKSLVHQFSTTEKINFSWLLYLIIWVVVIWIVILFVKKDELIYGSVSLFVLWLGYFGIKQVRVFSQDQPGPRVESSLRVGRNGLENHLSESEKIMQIELPGFDDNPENSKYQKSTLSEEDASIIHDRLKQLMAEQKPYTNPELTLNELARILEVHPNHLSQVINSKEKKSFYDLVNEMRVEEFLQLINKPSSQQYTLLALSYNCGFNSKASFNRNFKKYTGSTPRDYLKKQPAL